MAVKVEFMSVSEFSKIPDNPRQRDTERHAAKAVKNHLKKLCKSHRCVSVAAINGVPVCKLDGHTRCYLWNRNKLERPDELVVTVYEVDSIKEAADLYTQFDSTFAVEGSVDKLSGACRESGLSLKSQLLSRHNFNVSVKFAHHMKAGCPSLTEYEIIPKWAKVLYVIDEWNLPRNPFKGSGILSLMMVLVAGEEFPIETIREFFQRYAKDLGEKQGRYKDGVQALKEHMDQRRVSHQMTGYENIFDMIIKGYSCVSAFAENRMIVNVQPARDALLKCHNKARKNVDSGKFTIETNNQ